MIEPIFIMTSIAPYNIMHQAMSDLGVTSCGKYTYSIAPHEICSPYHFWMNVLFIVNGITLSVGVLYLSQYLKKNWLNKLATVCILTFAFGNIVSGFIPADINLFWHSIVAQIGMITVLFGLWIYAKLLAKGKRWTYFNLFVLIAFLILIILLFFFPLPAGLLQRLFYGVIFLWGTVLTILLND
ncbi:large-conductance mechanosensitive channel [Lysinibacillus parviboronicapiens]|uniref:Large-conductance mechanosensitive channel n=1 Tax=Lysinibacillus parviboronicapiens TaxID=436516 RepID=A0ABV2PN25_9BACI